MDIVDKMEQVDTGSHGHHDDVPLTDIMIEKAEIL
jgi:cyclophilin family peptidyl-prolyl cis-trans isomerase